MAKPKTLEELRDELADAFNTAVVYGKSYATSQTGPENLKAAAALAQAIIAVEDKIDQRNADRNGLRLPGKA